MHSSSVTVSTIPLQIVLPCWRISTWRPVYRLIRDAPPISVFLASRRDDPSALVADFTRLARETLAPTVRLGRLARVRSAAAHTPGMQSLCQVGPCSNPKQQLINCGIINQPASQYLRHSRLTRWFSPRLHSVRSWRLKQVHDSTYDGDCPIYGFIGYVAVSDKSQFPVVWSP
jgi:hypothetical protein